MARPHIEFVQSQALPWREEALPALRPGAAARTLSADDETGACSLLLRLPAGFALAAPQALTADEEVLVLDGELTLNGTRFGPYGYAHLPAGFRRDSLASDNGAVLLTFFSKAPDALPEQAFDPARLVTIPDALTVPYTGNFHPEFPPGAGRKMLFQDPLTGEQSWILGTLGLRWAERSEVHPVVEEMYLLAGEVHGDRGVMRPGAYFWRPPEVPHGPYGSLTGNIYFFRTRGGPLSTTYVEAKRPFRWWPEHAPVLPPGLPADPAPPAPRPW
jgi:hypothetical protein